MIQSKGQSIRELPQHHVLEGDGTWGWTAQVVGDDIIIYNAKVTCFGGEDDKLDSGETASGVSTKPDGTRGCALPRAYIGTNKAQIKALGGSPIPCKLPFGTQVSFSWNSITETCPFIDVGPAKWAKDQGDITVAVARKFKKGATSNNFEITGVTIRIIGGAKYV